MSIFGNQTDLEVASQRIESFVEKIETADVRGFSNLRLPGIVSYEPENFEPILDLLYVRTCQFKFEDRSSSPRR